MVELVDTQDLKSCGHCARAGSTPAPGTRRKGLTVSCQAFSFKMHLSTLQFPLFDIIQDNE